MSEAAIPSPASTDHACEVLIIGAGPVGLTMALELRRLGLGCRIVDKAAAATDKSKALVVWGRTLELLEASGDVRQDFFAAGRLAQAVSVFGNGQRLVHVRFERDDTAFAQPLMIPQSDTERILAERLGCQGVTVERRVELLELADRDQFVEAVLQRPDGRRETVRCDWLIGCDGAHSVCRKQLGIEFAGQFDPNDWILADVRIDGPLDHDEISIFWHARGIAAFFPIGTGGRFRVVADQGPALGLDKPPDPTLAQVQACLDERGLDQFRIHDPFWLAGFRIHERKVNEYGRGRVLLAGDAAHIHSPAGGQGMNTGMQDAFNLAWKLALVQRGQASPTLLASYHQERSAVGDQVLLNAGRLTRLATLRNPLLQFIRNQVAHFAGQFDAVQQRAIAQLTEFAICYHDSPLSGSSPGRAWSGQVQPGDRLPDAAVATPTSPDSVRLHSFFHRDQHLLLLLPWGRGNEVHTALARLRAQVADVQHRFGHLIHTIAVLPGESANVAREILPSAANAAGETILRDLHGEVHARLGVRDSGLALVRPDGYLAFLGDEHSGAALGEHLGSYLLPAAAAGA